MAAGPGGAGDPSDPNGAIPLFDATDADCHALQISPLAPIMKALLHLSHLGLVAFHKWN